MIASTMLFLFLVGCLAAVAAWMVERGLRGVGLPARWVWLGAMAVGPVLLALGALAPARAGTRSLGTLPTAVIDLPALVVGATVVSPPSSRRSRRPCGGPRPSSSRGCCSGPGGCWPAKRDVGLPRRYRAGA